MEKREITTIVLSTAALCLAAAIFAGPGPANTTVTPGSNPPAPARDSAKVKATTPGAGAAATTPSAPAAASGAATATGSAAGSTATGSVTATTTTTQGTATAPGATTAAVPGEYSDAEIMELVLAIDRHEIAAADVAQKKKIGKDAMKYAKMLHKAHTKDSAKVMKLSKKLKIAPAASPTSTELRAKGVKDVETLSGKDGAEFETAYIESMVKGHAEALALLDDRLLKYADNEDLKKQLADTRQHVADHLEQGKRLQGASAATTQP